MSDTNVNSLEYLCEVYKGLSPEHQDYVLDIARSLSKVQGGKTYPDNNEIVPGLGSASACAGEKIKRSFL